MQYLGRSNPKHVGGFNTVMRYKGLEFTTSWTFKTGHLIPNFNDYQNAPNNEADDRRVALGYSSDLKVSAQTGRESICITGSLPEMSQMCRSLRHRIMICGLQCVFLTVIQREIIFG